MNCRPFRAKKMILAFILTLSLVLPLQASAETELQWTQGSGQQIELGDGLANLQLGSGYEMLNAENTKQYERNNGGLPSEDEIGSVFPTEDSNWMVYFEYEEVGHVSDKDKESIDADALLKSYKDGTEEANKKLEEADRLFVDGWESEPRYDEQLHSLTWSLLAHDANQQPLVNYNVRMLTREGYVSAILVSDPEHLAASRKQMESDILSKFTIKEGKRYEDYDPSTDKKSNLGLTALVVGGTGLVVAKKVGLMALLVVGIKKFGIILLAALAGVWRWFRGKSSKKKQAEEHELGAGGN